MRHFKRSTTTVLAAALALTTSGARGQAPIGGEWRSDVDRWARRAVEAQLTPGVGIAVALDDWVAYSAGFGTADLDTGRPVGRETAFYIASSTKSLTATAVVLAAERGDLDLAAPMVRYLPAARLAEGVPRDRIKVRDLLTLTHGLAGMGPVVIRTAFTGDFSREQLLELLGYHEPAEEYGTFAYNNLGYNLLGMVLESVYGEGWKEVVRRLVIEPAGMTSTSAYRSRLDTDRLALPHAFGPDGYVAIPLAKQDANLHAAGGHFASARDLARYLAVHQSGGLLDGKRVLPRDPLAATHEQHVAQDRDFGPFHRHGWGYGWDLGTYGDETLIHRFGSFSGYRSHMSFMPEHGIGVAVLVNGSGPAASRAADFLAVYVYERLLGGPDLETQTAARFDELVAVEAEMRNRIAAHHAERSARLAPLLHPLADYAGTYESEALGRMTWRVVAGGLEVRMGVSTSRTEVYDAAADQLRFELAGRGQVAAFAFPDDGGPAESVDLAGTVFRRVEDPGR